MTTNITISVGGNYVAEIKDENGTVIGSAGPAVEGEGPAVSGSIYLEHGKTFTISERLPDAAADDDDDEDDIDDDEAEE